MILESDQFATTYGSAADDPYYQEWLYYQSMLDRGTVSGGVLEEPAPVLPVSVSGPAGTVNLDSGSATANPDGSASPQGASGPVADPNSMLNPGTVDSALNSRNVTIGGQTRPAGISAWQLIAVAVALWWFFFRK